MKYIIYPISVVLLISVYISYGYMNQQSPYNRILATEKDYKTAYEYLEKYEEQLTEQEMTELLEKLIVENMDATTINTTAAFIRNNQKCEFIPYMDNKCALFQSFPSDTVWYVNYRDDATRGSNLWMIERRNGLCDHLEQIKIECNYRH